MWFWRKGGAIFLSGCWRNMCRACCGKHTSMFLSREWCLAMPCAEMGSSGDWRCLLSCLFLCIWLQDCDTRRGFLTCFVMLQRRLEILLWVAWQHIFTVWEEREKERGLQHVNEKSTNTALLVVSKAHFWVLFVLQMETGVKSYNAFVFFHLCFLNCSLPIQYFCIWKKSHFSCDKKDRNWAFNLKMSAALPR